MCLTRTRSLTTLWSHVKAMVIHTVSSIKRGAVVRTATSPASCPGPLSPPPSRCPPPSPAPPCWRPSTRDTLLHSTKDSTRLAKCVLMTVLKAFQATEKVTTVFCSATWKRSAAVCPVPLRPASVCHVCYLFWVARASCHNAEGQKASFDFTWNPVLLNILLSTNQRLFPC